MTTRVHRRTVCIVAIAFIACSRHPRASTPQDACSKLRDRLPDAAAPSVLENDWFAPRCHLAGSDKLTPCMTRCDDLPSGNLSELCWGTTGMGCMQEAATRAAIETGEATRAVAFATGGKPGPGGKSFVLPQALSAVALRGKIWAATRDGHTLVYFPVWQGRHSNTSGFLYRDVPWPPVPKQLSIPGLPFETADGRQLAVNDEPEPFIVEKMIADQWLFVHYGWD